MAMKMSSNVAFAEIASSFGNRLADLITSNEDVASFVILFIGLIVGRQLLYLLASRLLQQKAPGPRTDPHLKTLKHAYTHARPMLPEPNELIELSKATGRTIEELNQWFRTMRAHERSLVVASRLSEAVWRLALLSMTVGIVLFADHSQQAQPFFDSRQSQLVRGCIHLHLVGLHLFSVRSMPVKEYLIVGTELAIRFGLVAFADVKLSQVITSTHDSVDALLEMSKFLDLIGLFNVAKVVFLVFIGAWSWLKSYVFPLKLVQQGYISMSAPLAQVASKVSGNRVLLLTYMGVYAQLLFDLMGFWTVLVVARAAFWTRAAPARRANRGDSLSSVTSLDYESDSSISSTLRHEPLKED